MNLGWFLSVPFLRRFERIKGDRMQFVTLESCVVLELSEVGAKSLCVGAEMFFSGLKRPKET